MEVIWKKLSSLLKRGITSGITFHDVLHEFRAGHGMGTHDLEPNLLQQLTSTRDALLFEVFLDLQMAYDAI